MAKLQFRRGDPFPDLELQARNGMSVRLSELLPPGQRAFVNLWATFCIPCRVEMPELQQLHRRFEAAGIQLVGISLDVDTASQVPAFLSGLGITYPTFTASADAIPRIYSGDEQVVPLSFVLDGDRRVVEVYEGWSDATHQGILRLLGEPAAVAAGD